MNAKRSVSLPMPRMSGIHSAISPTPAPASAGRSAAGSGSRRANRATPRMACMVPTATSAHATPSSREGPNSQRWRISAASI